VTVAQFNRFKRSVTSQLAALTTSLASTRALQDPLQRTEGQVPGCEGPKPRSGPCQARSPSCPSKSRQQSGRWRPSSGRGWTIWKRALRILPGRLMGWRYK
jgi:hypothetical protein